MVQLMSRHLFLLLVLAAIGVPNPASAQGFVTAIASGVVGKVLLNDANDKLQAMTDKLQRGGNALVGQSASEARVLIDFLSLNLSDQRERAVRDVDGIAKQAFVRLAEVMDGLEKMEERAYQARDATVVDVQNTLAQIWLLPDVTAIVAVRNLVVSSGPGEHAVLITGTGLGGASSQVSSALSLSLAGKPIAPLRINPAQNNSSTVAISRDTLQPFFDAKDEQVRSVPLGIELTAVRPRAWWKFWGSEGRQTIKTTVWLSLFPTAAGVVRITHRAEKFDWVRQPTPILGPTFESDDCGENRCKDHRFYSATAVTVGGGNIASPVPGSQRIVAAECSCQPLWGPYSCRSHNVRTPQVVEEGRRATCSVEHWGERNRYGVVATVDTWASTGIDESSSEPQIVRYATTTQVKLPATLTTYTVAFRSITGQAESIARGSASTYFRVSETREAGGVVLSITPTAPSL